MRSFRLENPVRLVFGPGSVKRVGRLLQVEGARNVLLVTGMASAEGSGALDKVLASLNKHGVDVAHRLRLGPSSCVEDLRGHAAAAGLTPGHTGNRVDAVLAVGGGSVMDAAKLLAAAPFLDDLWEPVAAGRHILRALSVFTVSTLPGSGSEVNDHALIANRELGIKDAAKGPALFPRASVADPALQVAPLDLTTRAAMDAMAHVMEHYVMCWGQETSLAVGEALMRALLASVRALRQSPDAMGPRSDLAWAGILAQNGTMAAGSGGGEWSVHVLAHALEAARIKAGAATSHAALVAALFPAWVETVEARAPELFQRWARVVWECDGVVRAVAAWRKEMRSWGLSGLEGQGFDRAALKVLAQDLGRKPLGRAFALGPDELDALVARAWPDQTNDSPY